ncbi:MAG TPA: GNAT family N-acetyltransferase [Jiangellaceae bacterium]
MSVVIGIESPLQDDIRKLVAALNDHLLPLSPTEFQFGISVDDMAEPRTTVFVARRDGVALGIGALTVHDDGTGEVKRMYTVPEARGAKIGARILDTIIEAARARGVTHLLLETGSTSDFASAHRLYERTGFRRRGPFHDYPDSGWSAFYELPPSGAG